MTTNNKDQDNIYYSKTFSFRLSTNEKGKELMLKQIEKFLNKQNLAFYDLKATKKEIPSDIF